MRLVVELDWLGNNWPTNGLTPFKNIENFGDSAYPHWIIKVHNELQEHHQHSAKLDDVVRVLDRMGGQGLFTDTEKMTHPSAVLFGIRDEVKRLSEQIKE